MLRVQSPRFPRGQLSPDDEGEIAFAIAVDHKAKLIRIEFGKSVSWMAMPLQEAKQLQQLLTEKIRELEEHPTKSQ